MPAQPPFFDVKLVIRLNSLELFPSVVIVSCIFSVSIFSFLKSEL